MLRVIITGSRHYADRAALFAELDALHARNPIACLIQGEARGADFLAKAWAISRSVPHEDYPADWRTYGRSAGPRRNATMLKESHPDAVVAFPDHWPLRPGSGTGHMVAIATAAGVHVRLVRPRAQARSHPAG